MFLIKRIKAILLLVLLTVGIKSTNSQSIAVPIVDSDYVHATFEELDFFRNEIKNVKVVALGEASHMSGNTMVAKTKMVKYLHKQCGFDTLAFESPMYEMAILNNMLQKGTLTAKDFFGNISGVWNIEEMDELFNYIVETQKTNRPLTCVGFDSNCFRNFGIGAIEENFKAFVQRLIPSPNEQLDSTVYSALHRVVMGAYSFKKAAIADTLLLYDTFNDLRIRLKDVKQDVDYYAFWKQIVDNFQTIYRTNYNGSNRDFQMAQNVLFYQQKNNSKLILWAATYHIANDLTSIKYYNNPKINEKVMGTYLKKAFGKQYYAIAFLPFQGKAGVDGALGLMKRKITTKKNSIEKYIAGTTDKEYAFVPLRKEEVQKLIEEKGLTQVNMFGASTRKMKIPEVVDGLFYLKNERLIHYH
ncbi:erythromycin esterase family protein [Plebeiibacterium sediminum]|uniref:Erythromycin esterase family protein n=1 Tax=Plebeiibacterium sediminum TaxID=2992112 RepID=A0AAE3SHL3_9BACT|nr:erythromycin esterase family protein [Plebeiobacterium sediminum]MCW3789556.1 erythromycin esterase family protein [Plebeiobacterium sediminum]